MTVIESELRVEGELRLSLSTRAARTLATTTKSEPQMRGISSRWLLRMLPWVQTTAGVYRVNQRRSYLIGDGLVSFTSTGAEIRVVPAELAELPPLRGFDDEAVLTALADRFRQQEFTPGEVIVEFGHQAEQLFLIAHGKVTTVGTGEFGAAAVLDVLADGEYFGERLLTGEQSISEFTVKALTPVTVLSLSRRSVDELLEASAELRAHLHEGRNRRKPAQNRKGEADIALAAGHEGEAELPATFVDYETAPREYELSVAQTVLRVHTRVADLFNDRCGDRRGVGPAPCPPQGGGGGGRMDQVAQQLRLTIEALRERQEHELINNRDFGLLHNADRKQRIHTRTGPPTPDDLDELLCRRRKPHLFLAHPRTIAAFGRECSRRGVYPQSVEAGGATVRSWRGVPMLPCDKIPITDAGVSSILVMRTGEEDEGVIGLHQTGIPDEYQPGLNVRFMGIDEKAVISYLVSAYYSAAILVPDALGVLDNVELGRGEQEPTA